MAAVKKASSARRWKAFCLMKCCTAKKPISENAPPGLYESRDTLAGVIAGAKDSALYAFLEKKKLERLIETEGASFQVPWYGQLMKGPQLIAHLAQIHTWFESYRIDIEE